MGIKSIARNVLTLPLLPELLSRLTQTNATVFTAHRFSAPDFGVSGHDPHALRGMLAELRKRRYDLISLEELFRRVRHKERLKRAVAFTIDDGYFDQASIAAPIFAEFDCPATIFTVTDFLDGKVWLWWDQMEYIFEQSRRLEIRTHLGDEEFRFELKTAADRRAYHPFSFYCQRSPHEHRVACIEEMSRSAEVDIPAQPPARYRPFSWDEARRLERKGISFGPHTLTHPVLATTSDEQSEREITESWKRLNSELSHPVPVFCYPAGGPAHFGDREVATVKRIGLTGAVTARKTPPNLFGEGMNDLYRLPRWGLTDELAYNFQCISGLQRLRTWFGTLSYRDHKLAPHPAK